VTPLKIRRKRQDADRDGPGIAGSTRRRTPHRLRSRCLIALAREQVLRLPYRISSRTVQAHLAHIFAKLGISSRVQLAAEVTRHAVEKATPRNREKAWPR